MFSGRWSQSAMWREQLGWTALRILLPWLLGAAVIALYFDTARLRALPAIGAARALWPAVLRLDREWREHAGRTELQLAAAEAAIAAVPDPVILIDRNRRIVRANAAWAEFIGSVSETRDLASAL